MSVQLNRTECRVLPEELDRMGAVPLGELMPWVWYSDPNGIGPDLLVGRKPAYMLPAGCEVKLGDQYKIVFVETPGDRRYAEDALRKPLVVRGGVVHFEESIDKTNMRPSTIPPRAAALVLYEPPADGWPWYFLGRLPFNIPRSLFGRQRYSNDAFRSEAEALHHVENATKLLRVGGISINLKTPPA